MFPPTPVGISWGLGCPCGSVPACVAPLSLGSAGALGTVGVAGAVAVEEDTFSVGGLVSLPGAGAVGRSADKLI